MKAFGSMQDCAIGNSMWHDMTREKDVSKLRAQIDENLKRVYDETLEEAVPDRFKELLAQLSQKDPNK